VAIRYYLIAFVLLCSFAGYVLTYLFLSLLPAGISYVLITTVLLVSLYYILRKPSSDTPPNTAIAAIGGIVTLTVSNPLTLAS
jgi:uncharacterized membrane protein YfcA